MPSIAEIVHSYYVFKVIKEKRKVPPTKAEIDKGRREALEGVRLAFEGSGAPLPEPVLESLGQACTAEAVSRSLRAKIPPAIVFQAINGKR